MSDNDYMKNYYKKTSQKLLEKCKINNRRIKIQVLVHYGGNPPKCACCGENYIEFLSIDHINNDGADQRKKRTSASLYYWLIKNNYPKGVQVLCFNCNCAKGFFGYCPHQKPQSLFKTEELFDNINGKWRIREKGVEEKKKEVIEMRTERITTDLRKMDLERLNKLIKKADTTRADYIRQVILDHIKTEEEKEKLQKIN